MSTSAKKGLPDWMSEAGFRAYAGYSIDALKAIMHNADSSTERVWACIVRNSWGYDSAHAVRVRYAGKPEEERSDYYQKHAVKDLKLAKETVSRAVARLVELGWLLDAPKRLQPIPVPARRPKVESDPAQCSICFTDWLELELKTERPDLYERFAAARATYLAELNLAKAEFRKLHTSATKVVADVHNKSLQMGTTSNLALLQPLQNPSSSLFSVVEEAVKQHCNTDEKAVQTLISKSQNLYPPATGEEIAQTVHEKAKLLRSRSDIANPMGFLLTAVPRAVRDTAERMDHDRERAARTGSVGTWEGGGYCINDLKPWWPQAAGETNEQYSDRLQEILFSAEFEDIFRAKQKEAAHV